MTVWASIDAETTGLDVVKDRVIEFGGVLFSTNQKKCLDSVGMLVKTDVPVSQEITGITGITQVALDRFGYEPEDVFEIIVNMLDYCDAVIGYNVRRFDKKVLDNWAHRINRELPAKPWVDLYADLPWQVPVGKLGHVAADHGILNLFPHSALADAQTVLAIAEKYDPQILLDRSQSPVVILRSHQDRSQNDLVKKARFRWNPERKVWWKPIKSVDVDEVLNTFQFKVSIDKELTQEELDN
jgi:DNA polymerase III epsilon subunit-like protein